MIPWLDIDTRPPHTAVSLGGGAGEGLFLVTLAGLWHTPSTPPHPPRVAACCRMGSASAAAPGPPSTWLWSRDTYYLLLLHRTINLLTSSSGTKCSEAELTQYRRPVGLGPSSKTCPRWPPHSLHDTSVRISPGLAIMRSRFPPTDTTDNYNVAAHYSCLMLLWAVRSN